MTMETATVPNTVLIIGMARSGTSVLANMFGAVKSVRLEVEPHALWKSGNFNYLNDEEFELRDDTTQRIRRKFLADCDRPNLVEKSPINCLRPELVHRVFPDARVIYINREPADCVISNYRRTLARDSFKPSLILRKYAKLRISDDLKFATSKRSILGQLGTGDLVQFPLFCLRMYLIRRRMEHFPFGPKLKGFEDKVNTLGIVGYHALVLKTAIEKKALFRSLYGDRFFEIDFADVSEGLFRRVLAFAEIDCSEQEFAEGWRTWRPARSAAKECCESDRASIDIALRHVGL